MKNVSRISFVFDLLIEGSVTMPEKLLYEGVNGILGAGGRSVRV